MNFFAISGAISYADIILITVNPIISTINISNITLPDSQGSSGLTLIPSNEILLTDAALSKIPLIVA